MAGHRASAPPLRHYRRWARTGAPLARSAGAPESPRCGEHDGAHPAARDLTVGECSSPVISRLSLCMTGGVGGPLSAAGVCAWVQTRVDLAISLADLKTN
jgi:hypothetical protein